MMKKRILLVVSLVLLLSVAAFGTLSYFTATEQAQNVITAGNVSIELYETGDITEGVTIMPGDVVEGTAYVENTGEHGVYLKVAVDMAVAEDETLDLEGLVFLEINEEAWTLMEDGFYYYNTALEAGAETEALFTAVSFSGSDIDNAYLGMTLTMTVTAYAVQSENNADSPFEAQGWLVE